MRLLYVLVNFYSFLSLIAFWSIREFLGMFLGYIETGLDGIPQQIWSHFFFQQIWSMPYMKSKHEMTRGQVKPLTLQLICQNDNKMFKVEEHIYIYIPYFPDSHNHPFQSHKEAGPFSKVYVLSKVHQLSPKSPPPSRSGYHVTTTTALTFNFCKFFLIST